MFRRLISQSKFQTTQTRRAMSSQSNECLGDTAFTRESLYGTAPEMTYGGALSFLRRKYTKSLFAHGANKDEHAEVVVSGVPYDGAVTYRFVSSRNHRLTARMCFL